MRNLLVYPFCREFSDLARYRGSILKYDNVIPVIPPGFGMSEKDISVCDGGKEVSNIIRSDYSEVLKEADGVFIGYVESEIELQDYIGKLKEAIDYKKDVYITSRLAEMIKDKKIYGQVRVLGYSADEKIYDQVAGLYNINVPVIGILGTGQFCDKFSTQLKIGELFRKDGYKVMHFGTKEFGDLLGVSPLPQFVFEPMDQKEKIIRLNTYIYKRVQKEKPDIIILGIPGGIMQMNPFVFNEFGEYAFTISNAIKTDLNILNIYAMEYTKEFLDNLLKICRYKYNMHCGYINVSNTDYFVSTDDLENGYITIRGKEVVENIIPRIPCDDLKIFSIFDEENVREIYDAIKEELAENIY